MLGRSQFELPSQLRRAVVLDHLNALTEHHARGCPQYASILRSLWPTHASAARTIEDVPYLPVEIFKRTLLRSVPEAEVFTTITSSGTTGQTVSRLSLDRRTAELQARALSRIMRTVTGAGRVPMLVIDRRSELRAQHARAIAIRGLLPLSTMHAFALGEDMRVDPAAVREFLARVGDGPFAVFGFTFVVWRFLEEASAHGIRLDGGVLIHAGGWKKLAELRVSDAEFKAACVDTLGLARVHNFYGMAEQTGSVFLQGGDITFRTPLCADIVIRDPRTLEPVSPGVEGLIQVLSVLPHSYPGHSILTEDIGVIDGVDDASDGWLGARFRVLGRAPQAELRGCSDVIGAML